MRAWQTFAAAVIAAAAVAATVVATGTAMRGGSTSTHSFTLLESDDNGSFSFIDNEPKSSRSLSSDRAR